MQQQQEGDSGDAQARETLEQQAAMEMQETIDRSRLQEAIPRCQPSPTKEIRIRRAEGVRLLGKEFRLEMTPEDQAAHDVAQAKEQMNMPTAAANTSDAGQEDDEQTNKIESLRVQSNDNTKFSLSLVIVGSRNGTNELFASFDSAD